MPATPADLARASTDEAARALAHQDNQLAIAAQRAAILDGLQGDAAAAQRVYEAWAPLKRSPGDTDRPRDPNVTA